MCKYVASNTRNILKHKSKQRKCEGCLKTFCFDSVNDTDNQFNEHTKNCKKIVVDVVDNVHVYKFAGRQQLPQKSVTRKSVPITLQSSRNFSVKPFSTDKENAKEIALKQLQNLGKHSWKKYMLVKNRPSQNESEDKNEVEASVARAGLRLGQACQLRQIEVENEGDNESEVMIEDENESEDKNVDDNEADIEVENEDDNESEVIIEDESEDRSRES